MAELIPAWCKSESLEMWPTQPLIDSDLRCSLHIHEDWSQQAEVVTTPMDVEHRYAGRNTAENLIINMMTKADPTSDITNWVMSIHKLVGFPILSMGLNKANPPEMLEWQAIPASVALAKQYAVDEIALFTGLARTPYLTRIYIMLARRKTIAWKVALTIESAVLPGNDEEAIINDHVRAGVTFGNLEFL